MDYLRLVFGSLGVALFAMYMFVGIGPASDALYRAGLWPAYTIPEIQEAVSNSSPKAAVTCRAGENGWDYICDMVRSQAPLPPVRRTTMTLSCRLNGERMQHASTEQMIFKIPKIIEYVSTWTTLLPGDVLVTGTPGGVGARRNPPIWMKPGDKVEIEIDKVGVLENSIGDG